MAVLNEGHVDRLRTLASVPVDDLSVVLAADEDVRVLRVVLDTDERRRRPQYHLWLVGIFCVIDSQHTNNSTEGQGHQAAGTRKQ